MPPVTGDDSEVPVVTIDSESEDDGETFEINTSVDGVFENGRLLIKQEVQSGSDKEDIEDGVVKGVSLEGASEASEEGSEKTKETDLSEDDTAGDADNFDGEEDGVTPKAVAVHDVGGGVAVVVAEQLEAAAEVEAVLGDENWVEVMASSQNDNLYYEKMVSYREGSFYRGLILFSLQEEYGARMMLLKMVEALRLPSDDRRDRLLAWSLYQHVRLRLEEDRREVELDDLDE